MIRSLARGGLAVTLLAGALGAASAGCGDVALGQPPGLLFWAGAEPGDTSEWTNGGSGIKYIEGQGQVEVVNAPVRRGAHAFRAIIIDMGGTLTQAVLFRAGQFPAEAYYSAWFRLAESHVTAYWAILKIQSLLGLGDTMPSDLWDLGMESDDAGTLTTFITDKRTKTTLMHSAVSVPIGVWFHIEMLFKAATDATGRIVVWQDGAVVLTVDDYATAPTPFLSFGVGNIATQITPNVATIDIDDAAISTARLGP
jgi:hypothetical protein